MVSQSSTGTIGKCDWSVSVDILESCLRVSGSFQRIKIKIKIKIN